MIYQLKSLPKKDKEKTYEQDSTTGKNFVWIAGSLAAEGQTAHLAWDNEDISQRKHSLLATLFDLPKTFNKVFES